MMHDINEMVVHCTEKWMYEEVLKWHEKRGNTWGGGEAPLHGLHYFDTYTDSICVGLLKTFIFIGNVSKFEADKYTIFPFGQFKQQFMEVDRVITISISTAKEWYEKGGDLKEVALQAYKEEELKEKEVLTWEDYEHGSEKHQELTYKQRKSIEAYEKILVLMGIYNDGWVADWNDPMQHKFIIRFCGIRIKTEVSNILWHEFYFKSPYLCDKFIANNEQLLKDYFMID